MLPHHRLWTPYPPIPRRSSIACPPLVLAQMSQRLLPDLTPVVIRNLLLDNFRRLRANPAGFMPSVSESKPQLQVWFQFRQLFLWPAPLSLANTFLTRGLLISIPLASAPEPSAFDPSQAHISELIALLTD
jgi:hypothetical protein